MRTMLFAVFVLSLSCGSSSNEAGDSASCGDFTPCGGSLVGTWKIASYCAGAGSVTMGKCETGRDFSEYEPSGTYTFFDKGTVSIQMVMNGEVKTHLSPGCFAEVPGGAMTCAEMGGSSASPSTGTTKTCTSGTDGDCQCTEAFSDAMGSKEMTYSTSGTSLSLSTLPTSVSPWDSIIEYCVQGNTLSMSMSASVNNDTMPTNAPSIMILTKQ